MRLHQPLRSPKWSSHRSRNLSRTADLTTIAEATTASKKLWIPCPDQERTISNSPLRGILKKSFNSSVLRVFDLPRQCSRQAVHHLLAALLAIIPTKNSIERISARTGANSFQFLMNLCLGLAATSRAVRL